MARPTHVYTIEYVTTLISENLELIEEVARNSDNIDYGEMIHAYDGACVCESPFSPWWRRRLAAVFAFPGLVD